MSQRFHATVRADKGVSGVLQALLRLQALSPSMAQDRALLWLG